MLYGDIKMATKRSALLLRLREEDREVIRQLAKYYDIAEADVIKILIREYLKNHNIDIKPSQS
jgi:replication initiation and membrane attachment protein DnaB